MQCSVPPDNTALSHLWVHAGQWQYHMSNDATYPVLLPIFLSALSERYRQDECVLCPHPYPTLTCSLPFNVHCAGHHSPTWHLRLSSIPSSRAGSMQSIMVSASRRSHLGALRVLIDCRPWIGATIK